MVFFNAAVLHGVAQCPVNAWFTWTRVCNNSMVHFTDSSFLTGTGQIVDWQWDFGDASPGSSNPNPNHNFPGIGTYTVTLIVTDSSGCTDVATIPVSVDPLPVAEFTFGPLNVCSGNVASFTFTGSGNGLTYEWNFGDGQTSSQQNPSHVFTSFGCLSQNFNVSLTVTDENGCSSTISHQVLVLQQPNVFYFEPNGFVFCHTDTSSISDTIHVYNFSPDIGCIDSYSIDWGDGTPASTSPPELFDGMHPLNHVYTNIGYYIVTITAVGYNGCQTVFTDTATVESNPVASLIGPPVGSNVGCAPLNVCVVNMSQNVSASTVMTVDWGDGVIETLLPSSVGQTICHNYLISGCVAGSMTNYAVILTAQNVCDFSQSSWSPVRVYEPPEAVFNIVDDSVCVGENATFINVSEPNLCAAASATWYTWDFGDGTTSGPTLVPAGSSPQQTIAHAYGDTGVYVVTLTANNSSVNGCGMTSFQGLVYVSQTYAQFSYDTVCFGDPTHFVDSSWALSSSIATWNWNFGDGGTSTVQNPNYTYTNWGDFNATLTVTSDAGCTAVMTHVVHVDTLPFVQFAWDTVCVGDPTTFTNLSYGRGAPIISYFWNFGDGNTSTFEDPTHIYGSAGSFIVTLTVTDANGCVNTILNSVPVSPPPIADFDTDTACVGSASVFTDQSTAPFGTIVSWNWDFGDGSGTSAIQNPTYMYADTGNYNVTLIVETNIGCVDTITLPVYVAPIPLADFTFNIVCAGNTTTFTDASQSYGWFITSWQWNFGDGNTATTQNPTHIYADPGVYTVSLIVANQFGCSDTIVHSVPVDSIPTAAFVANNACLYQTVGFTDLSISHGSNIVGWEWDFGDGTTSVLQNPTHIYAASGVYSVTLIVTSAIGCMDSASLPVSVYPLPEAGFTMVSACEGDPVSFTDTSLANGGSIVSWQWDFGDGSGTSAFQNPQYFYTDTGIYYVTLIVFNSHGCSDTVINPVYYLPRPTAEFVHDTSCAGQPITFTDVSAGNGSTIVSWTWDFGDGNTSALQNPVHPYATSGSFLVTLIVSSNSGCADTVQHMVVADSLPEPLFTAPSVCFNDTTYFTDMSIAHGSAINSWFWDFGDGNTSVQQNPEHLYGASGVYSVVLIVENINGCSDTIVQNVTVYALPVASFSYSGTCLSRDINFADNSIQGSGVIDSWTWDFGDGSSFSTNQNPVYQYAVIDSFLVTLIVADQYGCADTASDSIRVSPLPVSGFMADSVCLGLPTHFTDTSQNFGFTINYWEYDFGDGTTSNLQNPDHIYASAGNYTVQLIVGNISNCFDTVQQMVFVKPAPVAQFISSNICFGETSYFTDSSIPNAAIMNSWSWNFGDGNTSTSQNAQNDYNTAGTFPVELIVANSWNCTDTVLQNTTVYALPEAGFMSSVACLGFPTSFVDTSHAGSVAINGWEWDFGEPGGTSVQQNPTYTYVSGGITYSVTLIVEDQNGCVDTTNMNISLHPQPMVDFSATMACSGLPTSFTDLSVPAAGVMNAWDWNFGDGNTSALQNPQHTYPQSASVQTFNVTLIAYDDNGCPDTVTHTVTVNPQPVAAYSADTACAGEATDFTDLSSATAGAINTWDWDFGDGSGSSALQNPQYTYASSGVPQFFNATLMIEDLNGCRDTVVHPVLVNPLPVVSFSANAACTGSNTVFSENSFSNGGALTSWVWDFGDGVGASALQNPSYLYSTVLVPTNYNVNLEVTDINGCIYDTTMSVLVNPLPIASFNSISACSGFPSQFTDGSTSTGGNITDWDWDFGDGSGTAILQNPSYQYATTSLVTTYNVVLWVTDQNGCEDSVAMPATIYPSPVAAFVSDSVCSGLASQFTDASTSIGGAITAWSWDFGDGTGYSSVQSPSYNYAAGLNTASYPVTLIVENINGCFDTLTQNALVWPNPVVDFHSDIACMGSPTHFYDDSYSNGGTLQSWQWDFGDGIGTAAQQYPDYQYDNSGFYDVTLTVTDVNQCVSSAIENIVVDSLPIPDFTYTLSCTQGIVNFTNASQGNGSNIVGYMWDFGDMSNSGQVDPAHYYSATGNYDVTLYVFNDRGCSDSLTIPVNIQPGLEWDFSSTQECVGEPTVFNDFAVNPNVPAVAWFWNFGDGSFSTLEDPTHLYLVSGTYNVLLTVTDAMGCAFSVLHNVVVNPRPVADFSATIVTQGNPTTFTDLSSSILGTIISWSWDFDDGNTSALQNPLHTYALSGTYDVTLIVFNNFGCSDTTTIPITVLPLVEADFVADTVCAKTPMSFSDLSVTGAGTIDYWYWNFGDGYSSALQNPQHTYYNSGVFTVTLIATNTSGISDSTSHQVLVLEAPTAEFLSTSVCQGNATAFMNQSSGTTSNVIGWTWDLGDGDNNFTPSFNHLYDTAGNYNVSLIVVNTIGCRDTVSHQVNVWEIPQVNIAAAPQEGCLPLDVVFTDLTTVGDGTITSWLWQFGDGYTSVSAGGAFHGYTAPGMYGVNLFVTSNHGCSASASFPNYIQAYPNPIASFYYFPTNPSLSDPGVNMVDISVGASSWNWDFSDGESSTEQSPMHEFPNHGNYEITLIAGNSFGCYDTTSLPIHVAADELLYIPNAITPNGDGRNDWFMPFGAGWSVEHYEMRIYNRWGQLIFVTTDINHAWDGTMQDTGELVQTGVYVWKVWYVDLEGKKQNLIGRVTVTY
ncbi:MAG TPA: PKD domain-containing protein [Bacteroidales bacterium]|nr:PKD domain-containing protein [Bacteroidales bacterium]